MISQYLIENYFWIEVLCGLALTNVTRDIRDGKEKLLIVIYIFVVQRILTHL